MISETKCKYKADAEFSVRLLICHWFRISGNMEAVVADVVAPEDLKVIIYLGNVLDHACGCEPRLTRCLVSQTKRRNFVILLRHFISQPAKLHYIIINGLTLTVTLCFVLFWQKTFYYIE